MYIHIYIYKHVCVCVCRRIYIYIDIYTEAPAGHKGLIEQLRELVVEQRYCCLRPKLLLLHFVCVCVCVCEDLCRSIVICLHILMDSSPRVIYIHIMRVHLTGVQIDRFITTYSKATTAASFVHERECARARTHPRYTKGTHKQCNR